MGHGFGATTAIVMGSKDRRIRKLVTLDPWIAPLKEEILDKVIGINQAHCSVNSELFNDNVPENWMLLTKLFDPSRRFKDSPNEGSILSMLTGVGHMAFSDLSLLLLLELRLIQFSPSFA